METLRNSAAGLDIFLIICNLNFLVQMNTLMTSKPVGMAVNSDEGGMRIITYVITNVLNFSTPASHLQSFAKKKGPGSTN